jgi:3,4-dihydroxy 2-butanone 4-phosphate synthase/GTP cyclohydrolase II
LQRAMAEIGREGAGLIVLLIRPQESGEAGGGEARDMDLRAYGIGAQILADMGVHELILLTNSHRNIVAIEGYGLNIVGERPIPAE